MDPANTAAGEALLQAWLSLTAVVCNRRMVSGLTFNEAVVCNHLLHQARAHPAQPLTATDLCEKTNMLKSQMNQVLSTLERQGFLCRSRSQADRRQVELTLTPEGETAYLQAHRQVEVLLKELVDRLGTEAALALAQQLEQSIAAIQDIYAQQKGTL